MNDEPKLLVKVSKKLKTLSFSHGKDKVELEIEDGQVNIIELDVWLTELFKAEYEKAMLRQRLSGK